MLLSKRQNKWEICQILRPSYNSITLLKRLTALAIVERPVVNILHLIHEFK